MASTGDTSEPLLGGEDGPETTKQKCWRWSRYCVYVSGVGFLVVFAILWAIQGIIYAFATHGCKPSALENYHYPSGDSPGRDLYGYNSTNMLPKNQLMAYHDGWPTDTFHVTRTTEYEGMGEVGSWFRYGGPLFTTYVFMDIPSGIPTAYIRQNMLRLGMSHRIARCDESGPYVEFYEGSNWILNRMRRNRLFSWFIGRGTDTTFKISFDGVHVADSLESMDGMPSISFTTLDRKNTYASGRQLADSLEWALQNDFAYDGTGDSQILPYYVTSGCTMLFAFSKEKRDARRAAQSAFEIPSPRDASRQEAEAAVSSEQATSRRQPSEAEGGSASAASEAANEASAVASQQLSSEAEASVVVPSAAAAATPSLRHQQQPLSDGEV